MYCSLNQALQERPAESWLLPGLATGYTALDRALGGIQPGDLIFVVARRGDYGQILTENLAAGLARKCPVLYLSTDRKAPVVASELQSVLMPATEEERHDDELLDRLNRYAQNLYLDEAVFPEDIDEAVETFRSAFPGDAAVVVDTLNGLLLTKDPIAIPREAEEERMADNLKRLALKFRVPVILYKRLGPADNNELMHLTVWSERFDRVVGVSRPGKAHPEAVSEHDPMEQKVYLHVLKGKSRCAATVTLRVNGENRFVIR